MEEEERWKIKEWEGKRKGEGGGGGGREKSEGGRCSWDGAEGTGRTGARVK